MKLDLSSIYSKQWIFQSLPQTQVLSLMFGGDGHKSGMAINLLCPILTGWFLDFSSKSS